MGEAEFLIAWGSTYSCANPGVNAINSCSRTTLPSWDPFIEKPAPCWSEHAHNLLLFVSIQFLTHCDFAFILHVEQDKQGIAQGQGCVLLKSTIFWDVMDAM